MSKTYDELIKTVASGSVEEADLTYDAAMLKWCFEFNREPPLDGNFLNFSSWDELTKFSRSIPEKLEYLPLMEKAVSLYAACYSDAKKSGPASKAIDLGLKFSAAMDKTVGKDDKIKAVYLECIKMGEAAGEWTSCGRVYLGLAHSARYRTYDSKAAFNLLHSAQDCFVKAGDTDSLRQAYWTEMSILDPDANDGLDADLNRFQDLYKRCTDGFTADKKFEPLVNLHIFAHEMLVRYKRLDLVSESLKALLDLVQQHFPDQYERNIEGVRGICTELGLAMPNGH